MTGRWPWVLAGCALALGGWVALQTVLHGRALADDAYIFFRYADNLLAGHGPVFNPGERVEGFTSPLWLGLLTLVGALNIDLTVGATLAGGVCCAAALMLVLYVPPSLGLRPAYRILAAGLAAAHLSFTYWATSGMETALFSLLILATVARLALERERDCSHAWSGILAGLAMLTRPEAALLVLALAPLTRSRRGLGSFVAGVAPLPVLYELFRLLYYGQWLPNTARVKAGFSAAHLELGAAYVRDFAIEHPLLWLALLPLLLRRRCSLTLALYGYLVLTLLQVIWVGGDFFDYHRFLAPQIPLLALLAGRGLQTLADRLAPRGRPLSVGPVALLAAAAAVIGFDRGAVTAAPRGNWTTASGKLGRALRRAFPPGTLVACPHIGAVGYYSSLPIHDMLGLTEPHIARQPVDEQVYRRYPYRDPGHEKFDIDHTLSMAPGVIALSRAYSGQPATHPSEVPRAFAAEHALMDRLRSGQHPYVLENLRIDRAAYWMILRRRDQRRRRGAKEAR